MPGQLKEVRNRIQSVQSTQQITKAMKMVSAAKLRRAQDAIIQLRPYAQKLQEMLGNIVANTEGDSFSLSLAQEREIHKVLLIVITSDRGLAGAYNANIIKAARQLIQNKYASLSKENITIWNVGKKGWESLTKAGYHTSDTYKDMFLNLSFEAVQNMAQEAVKAFQNKEFDVIEIIYSEFKNAVVQRFVTEQFLPIQKTPSHTNNKQKADFIFDPNKEDLIAMLIPKILNMQLYKAMLDAQASEHGARMTAMDKATENANEILRNLRISYNSARQAAITTELTEIISGAAALQG